MMKKDVVGVYDSSFETILAVEDLKKSGFINEQIIVVGRDSFATSLIQDKTGVKVERDLMEVEEEKTGFWSDLMGMFRGKKTDTADSNDLGLSKQDLVHYTRLLEHGKILILTTEPPSYMDGDGIIIPTAQMESSSNELQQ